MKRNLLIVRAGDDSLHYQWLGGAEPNFDLFVSYYGHHPEKWRGTARYYHAQIGTKWPVLDSLCHTHWDIISGYDYIGLLDDDMRCTAVEWNALFDLCREYSLDLAQPAVPGVTGHKGWPFTQPQPGKLLRYTNFVEIQAPVFNLATLDAWKWTFGESVGGWGIDFLWSHFITYPTWRLAIVDKVVVEHSRPPMGGNLYQVVQSMGIDPYREYDRVYSKFRIPRFEYKEYGHIDLPGGHEDEDKQER